VIPKGITASKWNYPIEGLMAIYALRPGGIFMEPADATQMFGQLVYHIRGTTLYQALLNLAEFDNDALA